MVNLITKFTIVIIVATTFNSCGYGNGDTHPDVKNLSSLNNYPEKFRLLDIIEVDSGKIKMMDWKSDFPLSFFEDYNNLHKAFPGKNSWYYITKHNNYTFFDCSMTPLLSVNDIIGYETSFTLYPIEAGKISIDVYTSAWEKHNNVESLKSKLTKVLLVDIDSKKVYRQFEYIEPWFINSVLHYMKDKGDTLRTLNPIPPLFHLDPKNDSLYEKEIKHFHKIYPHAQRDILQLIDKHSYDYISIDGDSMKSFDYDKVYYGLLERLQYAGSTGSSSTPAVYHRSGELFFMNHSVAIGYYGDWKPDSVIPSLLKFKNLPDPQNQVNVALHQFDYSLVWQSYPHLLKGSSTRDELYYYTISVGNDTLQFKTPIPVYLFESRRLKNDKVAIALSTEDFNPKDRSKKSLPKPYQTKVFFLLYDPKK
ncbi:hypothetical protein [Bacteroides congonensis]